MDGKVAATAFVASQTITSSLMVIDLVYTIILLQMDIAGTFEYTPTVLPRSVGTDEVKQFAMGNIYY